MVIANPIYDVVFKRLMENDKVVKFFIGTLMDEVIESVQVLPQEFTYTQELVGISIFRLDFIATIQTATGEVKKVLIEIQKARNLLDLMRFRQYLAAQYKKEDTVHEQEVALPITTIYILGFPLPSIESACIKVERQYRDLVTNSIIAAKSDFIEKLTHDSFVVQVGRITDRYQSRLDKLLSIFEQRHFTGDTTTIKEFLHEPDVEGVRLMTDILHYVGTEPKEREQLDIEQEAWRSINAVLGPQRVQLEQTQQELEQAQQELEQAQQELEQAQQELGQKDQVLEQKDQQLEEQQKIIQELRRKLGEQ